MDEEVTEVTTGSNLRVLSNGAVYDMERGRIVANPGGGKHAITSESARDMQMLGVRKKREVVARAANRSVGDASLVDEFGEFAWLADATQTQMAIATTPDAGKAAVMAASWLVDNAGMAEPKAGTEAGPVSDAIDQVRGLLRDIATAARALPRTIEDTD